jgi:hypothetical protein
MQGPASGEFFGAPNSDLIPWLGANRARTFSIIDFMI